jgi:glycosyltransferase involved in cell wall biosynthesis
MSKLAVLMAARNQAPFIAQALHSVLRQRQAATLDIVVVDDGSTDATADIVARLAEANPEIRLVRGAQRGIAAARNRGLGELVPDTDFVTFLDADDLSPDGHYAQALARFEQRPELDLVYGTTRWFRQLDEDRLEPTRSKPWIDVRVVQLAAGVYRAAIVAKVGAFDEQFTMGEDMDFLLRILETVPSYDVMDEVAVYYRRHADNATRDHIELRRGFALALLKSAKRRRHLGDFAYPPELFDGSNLAHLHDW